MTRFKCSGEGMASPFLTGQASSSTVEDPIYATSPAPSPVLPLGDIDG